MKIVFLGTPEEVLLPLKALSTLSGHELIALVSQPARPAGRKRLQKEPPVALFAKEKGLPLFQPDSAGDAAFLDSLINLSPDLMVTAAYGQILSEKFLAIPKKGTINLHPSLLPKYRGATPVQSALLNQDSHTGMTILYTVKKLDAGDIILQEKSAILPFENTKELLSRMFGLGAKMLPKALSLIEDESFGAVPQREEDVVKCHKISKEDGEINWRHSQKTIMSQYLAYFPWPGSYTFFNTKRVVITKMIEGEQQDGLGRPGQFSYDKKSKVIRVCCGSQGENILISHLKPAGSKELDAQAFWNGKKIKGQGEFHVT